MTGHAIRRLSYIAREWWEVERVARLERGDGTADDVVHAADALTRDAGLPSFDAEVRP